MRTVWIWIAMALVMASCRDEVPPVPAPQGPVTTGQEPDYSLFHVLPVDTQAWIYVDVDDVAADPRLDALWQTGVTAVGGGPLSDALRTADGFVTGWTDATFNTRIAAVAAPIDRQTLYAELRSATNFSGEAFRPEMIGPYKVWRQGPEAWAISAPTDDLLVTGDRRAVMTAIETLVALRAEPDLGGYNPRSDLEAELVMGRFVRQYLREVVGDPRVVERLERIASVRVRAWLGLGLDVEIELRLVPDTDARALVALLALGLSELVDPLGRSFGDPALFDLLLDRLQLEIPREEQSRVRLRWELSRDDVDELLARLDPDFEPPAIPSPPPTVSDGSGTPTTPAEGSGP